jgi:hypothetical protein
MSDQHEQYHLDDPVQKGNQPPAPEDWYGNSKTLRTDKDLIIKDFYTFDDSEFFNRRGEKLNIKIVTTDYYIKPDDFIIGVVSTTAARTVYLPPTTLVGPGKHYIIFDAGGSATSNLITVNGNGYKINGESTKGLSTNYKSMDVVTGLLDWYNLNV